MIFNHAAGGILNKLKHLHELLNLYMITLGLIMTLGLILFDTSLENWLSIIFLKIFMIKDKMCEIPTESKV